MRERVIGELRAALAAGGELLHRAELQQDAGEGLRQAVVDLLADAGALHEHRGFLGRVGEPGELHGERRLLRERHQQLAARHLLGVAAEAQTRKPTLRAPNTSGIDHDADGALAPVKASSPGQISVCLVGDVDIERLAQIRVARGERRAGDRHAGRVRRRLELRRRARARRCATPAASP